MADKKIPPAPAGKATQLDLGQARGIDADPYAQWFTNHPVLGGMASMVSPGVDPHASFGPVDFLAALGPVLGGLKLAGVPFLSMPGAGEAPSATFHGWQPGLPEEGIPHVPLYNINGGPLHQSTVSAETLTKNGIPVPETPPFGTPSMAFVPAGAAATVPKAPVTTDTRYNELLSKFGFGPNK